MPAKIKICGINALDAVKSCNNNHADFVGLVFVSQSPRFITLDLATTLCKNLNHNILKTGLFADPQNLEIETVLSAISLDYIQLHGKETPQRVQEIKTIFAKPIIKAVSIKNISDINDAKPFYDVADIVLFDAKAPANSKISGGNGLFFDWTLLKNIPQNLFWGLAGGLNPENVKYAITLTGAKMVDVSSGVEKSKGLKDPALIQQFIKEARNAV